MVKIIILGNSWWILTPFLEVNFNFWRNKKQVRWPSRRDLYESGVFEGHTQLSVQKSFFTEKICDPHDGENCHKNNNAGSFGTYIKNKKVVSWSEKSESGVRSRTYYLQQEKTLQNRQITFPQKTNLQPTRFPWGDQFPCACALRKHPQNSDLKNLIFKEKGCLKKSGQNMTKVGLPTIQELS